MTPWSMATASSSPEAEEGQEVRPSHRGRGQAFLADAEEGKKSERKVTGRFQQIERESSKNILFETSDREQKGVNLRRSYVVK